MELEKKLIKVAKESSQNAYAKYSNFKLGVALLGKSGKIYRGCNVENGSFGLTNCAERSAIFTAISEGEKEFISATIFIDSDKIFPPCGACRQVFAEFCDSDFKIVYLNKTGKIVKTTLGELLPQTFHL